MCDLELVHVGPCSVDLSFLLADFIVFYYKHMLTPENNDWHRRVAYQLLDASRMFGNEISTLFLAVFEESSLLLSISLHLLFSHL